MRVRQPRVQPYGLGELTFGILTAAGARVVRVAEDEIRNAATWCLDRLKLVVEPSAATAVAALPKLDVPGPVGVILSGGNTDLGWLRDQESTA